MHTPWLKLPYSIGTVQLLFRPAFLCLICSSGISVAAWRSCAISSTVLVLSLGGTSCAFPGWISCLWPAFQLLHSLSILGQPLFLATSISSTICQISEDCSTARPGIHHHGLAQQGGHRGGLCFHSQPFVPICWHCIWQRIRGRSYLWNTDSVIVLHTRHFNDGIIGQALWFHVSH